LNPELSFFHFWPAIWPISNGANNDADGNLL